MEKWDFIYHQKYILFQTYLEKNNNKKMTLCKTKLKTIDLTFYM